MLAAVSQTQPDYVALVMVIVLLLFVAVAVLRKRFASAKSAPAPQPEEQPCVAFAPGSAGRLKLYNVEPKVAAMLMAIVAYKMGKPLNELRFISIREVMKYETETPKGADTGAEGSHGYSL